MDILQAFLFFMIFFTVCSKDVEKLCRSIASLKSCGQCIKQHPDCAWCLDPNMEGVYRCDTQRSINQSCNVDFIYQPISEQKIISRNISPANRKHDDDKNIVQLEPQQVFLRMKPGDIQEIKYKYFPNGATSLVMVTSDYKSTGVGIDFSIYCNGALTSGRQCAEIKPFEHIEVILKVSLNKCTNSGDIAISVGAHGYNAVSGIYITPICGCECEKIQNQQNQSEFCSSMGKLICGVCECHSTRVGVNCECDLKSHGVSSAKELEDRCKNGEDHLPLCSGNGRCSCGKCTCNGKHITGEYCECNGMDCPKNLDGVLCGGQGVCSCGTCQCEEGYTSDDCTCISDKKACIEDGKECSDNGICTCGKCVCNAGFTGKTCGVIDGDLTSHATSEDLDSSDKNSNGSNANDNYGEILPDSYSSEDNLPEDGEKLAKDEADRLTTITFLVSTSIFFNFLVHLL